MTKQNKTAVICSIFYTEQCIDIATYINRISFDCDVHLTISDKDAIKEFTETLEDRHKVYLYDYVDYGMDIGNFLNILEKIIEQKLDYDYFLKIHSKKDARWRTTMFEACMPKKEGCYEDITKQLDDELMTGSNAYLFDFENHFFNSDLIFKRIEEAGLKITKDEVWHEIIKDRHKEELDPSFYINFHQDLKSLVLPVHNSAEHINSSWIRDWAKDHWEKNGKKEKYRIPSEKCLQKSKNIKPYKFFAGTCFWFSKNYLQILLKTLEPFETIKQKLQKEKHITKNVVTTYTHHLEYWFGLVASYENIKKQKKLSGIRTTALLTPNIGPDSGGFRTILKQAANLQKNGHQVTLCVCNLDHLDFNMVRNQINFYINNNYKDCDLDTSKVLITNDFIYRDTIISTGWQTFQTSINYISANTGSNIGFLCQDLEFLFKDVNDLPKTHKDFVENYYRFKIPTFTLSYFLEQKNRQFNTVKKIKSTGFNANTNIYFDKKQDRDGICMLLCHPHEKPHRLPYLVEKLANEATKAFPKKKITLYGYPDKFKHGNIECVGIITPEETADLYNSHEVGLCFSTTNPSRIPFEMAACGLPCIEAKNEFTEFDLDAKNFLRISVEEDEIAIEQFIKQCKKIFKNFKNLNQAANDFSKQNFEPNKEEKALKEFIEKTLTELDIETVNSPLSVQ